MTQTPDSQQPDPQQPDLEALREAIASGDPVRAMPALTQLRFCTEEDAVPLLDNWKSAFPETPLHCIGKITDQPGIALRDDKGVKPLTLHGYDHLEQS